MMKLPTSIVEQIEMDLQCKCAEDPETGAYLTRSNGRRKAGRPRKYWYHQPQEILPVKFTAYSDQEAVDMINREVTQ